MASKAEINPIALLNSRQELSREMPGVMPVEISPDAAELTFNFRVTSESLMPLIEVDGDDGMAPRSGILSFMTILLALYPDHALSASFVAEKLAEAGIQTTQERVLSTMRSNTLGGCELNKRTGKRTFTMVRGTQYAYLDAKIKVIPADGGRDDAGSGKGDPDPGADEGTHRGLKLSILKDPIFPYSRFVMVDGLGQMSAQIKASDQALVEELARSRTHSMNDLYKKFKDEQGDEKYEGFMARLDRLSRNLTPAGLGIFRGSIGFKEVCGLMIRKRDTGEKVGVSVQPKDMTGDSSNLDNSTEK